MADRLRLRKIKQVREVDFALKQKECSYMMREKGIAVSPGIAITEAYLHAVNEPAAERSDVQVEDVQQELQRLEQAVVQSAGQLQVLRAHMEAQLGAEDAAIFTAHLTFLDDPAFVGQMRERIQHQRIPAERSVRDVVDGLVAIFESLDDAHMSARAADIRDVGNRITCNLTGRTLGELGLIDRVVVLVAQDLTPSETMQLPLEHVKGILLAKGGAMSHAAILARSLGIPAVFGVGAEFCGAIQPGDPLILDGSTGDVLLHPAEDVLAEYTDKAEREKANRNKLDRLLHEPAVTTDGHRIELAANIGSVQEAARAFEQGAEGIGLFRSEFLFMDRDSLPSEEEQYAAYSEVAATMQGRPVIIRTLDIGGDKRIPAMELPKEDNPFLGWRAIRISLRLTDMFKSQLRAILRAGVHGKVLIMFPMISHVEQVRAAKRLLEEAKAELQAEAIPYDADVEVGIMIEIPAACMLADALAKEVNFFSIGTNDLVQYTVAVDRMNDSIAELYNYFHPAVLRLVKQVCDAAERNGIWTGICGEMAGDPAAAELLVGLGLREFSVSASSLLTVKERIRSLSFDQAREVAAQALELGTVEEIQGLLKK